MEIINLNQAVYNALNFFQKNPPTPIHLRNLNFPLVVGSGNAYNTGFILFNGMPALFANESNLEQILKNYKPLFEKKIIRQAVVISASGAKDSVWELEAAKKHGLKTILLTCTPDAPAVKVAGHHIVYNKLPEPYTYNVSTYLGMILSVTGEKPATILKFLQNLKINKNFKKYKSYAFILPNEYAVICRMITAKADELWGPHIAIRAFTQGRANHAKFINRTKDELVITLGDKNNYFGEAMHRLDLKLPKKFDAGLMFCLVYILLGGIQEAKPAYFKKNIAKYCATYGPQAYGKKEAFGVIV
jgi:hypothetical protein